MKLLLLGVAAAMLATPASAEVVRCPNGVTWAGSDIRRCPCCKFCPDGSWYVEGEGDCEGRSTPVLPKKRAAPPKTLTIERTWEEYDFGNVLVTFRNQTGRQLEPPITIHCTAFDSSGRPIAMNRRSWFDPLPPDFVGRKEIPIELHGRSMAKADCRVTGLPSPRAAKDRGFSREPGDGYLFLLGLKTLVSNMTPIQKAALALLYLVPTGLALYQRRENTVAVALLNLGLGWTGFGWIAAMALALRETGNGRA